MSLTKAAAAAALLCTEEAAPGNADATFTVPLPAATPPPAQDLSPCSGCGPLGLPGGLLGDSGKAPRV